MYLFIDRLLYRHSTCSICSSPVFEKAGSIDQIIGNIFRSIIKYLQTIGIKIKNLIHPMATAHKEVEGNPHFLAQNDASFSEALGPPEYVLEAESKTKTEDDDWNNAEQYITKNDELVVVPKNDLPKDQSDPKEEDNSDFENYTEAQPLNDDDLREKAIYCYSDAPIVQFYCSKPK